MNKLRSLLSKLVLTIPFLLTIGMSIAILFSYLAVYVDPNDFWPLAFLGLAYPFCFWSLIAAFVFWFLLKKWKLCLLIIAVLGTGYSSHQKFFATVFKSKDVNKKGLKVMSYNVHLFEWYNWKENTALKNKIIRFLEKQQPDVICFQEYFEHTDKKVFDTKNQLKETLNMPYRYISETARPTDEQIFGIVTMSKYPIVHQQEIQFEKENGNRAIVTDIVYNNDTIRVYNAHLGSIRFQKEDYKYVGDFQSTNQMRRPSKEGRQIIKRLKSAFLKRNHQIQVLKEDIEKSAYPVIFCGDINDSPLSYAYGQLTTKLNDSFLEASWGVGSTYLGKFPSFRIDYILHSKEIQANKYYKYDFKVSDHRPIMTQLTLD